MSAHVLLNLLNKLRNSNEIQGFAELFIALLQRV